MTIALSSEPDALPLFFVRELERELKEPFQTVSPGRVIEKTLPDPRWLHLDNPAVVDQLGRQAFCDALANRLGRIWNENCAAKVDTSFVLHLHGPWGAGKSTLLNLLRESLQPSSPESLSHWVVIDFNAWQNQRLDPPWWPLLDRIYRQAFGQLSGPRRYWFWLREHWWRFITANWENVLRAVGVSILAAIVGLLVWRFWPSLVQPFLPAEQQDLSKVINAGRAAIGLMTALVGALAAIWGFISRPFLSGSAKAAQTFVQSAVNPMEKIQIHFKDLMAWINSPVLIFIDDLDRCRSEYVVGLLEGIQTLFKDPRVLYLISADRRWLHCCFEKSYAQFKAKGMTPEEWFAECKEEFEMPWENFKTPEQRARLDKKVNKWYPTEQEMKDREGLANGGAVAVAA